MSFILAEFKGTYRAPSPGGHRDVDVLKQFHVKVKMKRDSLNGLGLEGLFSTYYKSFLKKFYPDMIDTYEYHLVRATELDGTKIDRPIALDHDGLLDYIRKRNLPINPLLFTDKELRDEVILYENDPKGQQHLQERRERLKGNMLLTAAELNTLDELMVPVSPYDSDEDYEPVAPVEPPAPARQPDAYEAAPTVEELLAKPESRKK